MIANSEVVGSAPLLVIAMGGYVGLSLDRRASHGTLRWAELLLGTPVVLWGGWPFFVRGWRSIVHRSLNMFTLIGLVTSVAYVYSLVATLAPDIFPQSFREQGGGVGVYFKAATVVVTRALLGRFGESVHGPRPGGFFG